jgi:hypothetical protein
MSEGWSYDRYIKSLHDDDAEDCDCLACREHARDDYYAELDND